MTFPGAVLDVANLSAGYGGMSVCGPITARADAGEILGSGGPGWVGDDVAPTTTASHGNGRPR